jgi:hypothetical protein
MTVSYISSAANSSTDAEAALISPEAGFLLKEFCRINREKYGKDWKKIFAKEMAAEYPVPFLQGARCFFDSL